MMNEFYKNLFFLRNESIKNRHLFKDDFLLESQENYKLKLYSQLLELSFSNISNPDELPKVFDIYSRRGDEYLIKHTLEELNVSANVRFKYKRSWISFFEVSIINSSFPSEDKIPIKNNVLEGLILIRNWCIDEYMDKHELDKIIDVYSRLLILAFTNYSHLDQFPEIFFLDRIDLNFNDFYFHMEKVLEFTKTFVKNLKITLTDSYSWGINCSPSSFSYLVNLVK